jgi:hypothetical protein
VTHTIDGTDGTTLVDFCNEAFSGPLPVGKDSFELPGESKGHFIHSQYSKLNLKWRQAKDSPFRTA